MKSLLPLGLTLLGLLTGCGASGFAARQAEWNRHIGMGGMNGPPMTSPGEPTAADKDAETQLILESVNTDIGVGD